MCLYVYVWVCICVCVCECVCVCMCVYLMICRNWFPNILVNSLYLPLFQNFAQYQPFPADIIFSKIEKEIKKVLIKFEIHKNSLTIELICRVCKKNVYLSNWFEFPQKIGNIFGIKLMFYEIQGQLKI